VQCTNRRSTSARSTWICRQAGVADIKLPLNTFLVVHSHIFCIGQYRPLHKLISEIRTFKFEVLVVVKFIQCGIFFFEELQTCYFRRTAIQQFLTSPDQQRRTPDSRMTGSRQGIPTLTHPQIHTGPQRGT